MTFHGLFSSYVNSLSPKVTGKVKMKKKEDKVKQEIMKNLKSMRYTKHDRIKGYKTGMLEPVGKDIQESSAVSRMTGKPELGRIFEL